MTATWVYDDGGRQAAGYRGTTGDCIVRAVAISTELPYQQVYDAVNAVAKTERRSKKRCGQSSARTGIYPATLRRFMRSIGWNWMPTMHIGSGCTIHLKSDELPPGRLVVSVSRHQVAVVDGIIHDTEDCSRGGTRCVYGYYRKAPR